MKSRLLILLGVLIAHTLPAQPVQQFSTISDINHGDEWSSNVLVTDSGYIITYVSSLNPAIADNALVIGFYNNLGEETGRKYYRRPVTSYYAGIGGSLSKTSNNELLFGSGLLQDSFQSRYKSYAALYKLTNLGDTILIKGFGGIDFTQGFYARELSDGNYLLAGETNSLTGGNGTPLKGYLVKTDTSGNKIWEKIISLSETDRALFILPIDSGFFIAGGSYQTNVTKTFSWIIKYNNDGSEIWRKKYGDTAVRSGMGIDCSELNKTSFWALEVIDSIGGQNEFFDFAIDHIDMVGDLFFHRSFRTEYAAQFHTITGTIDGGFVICGLQYAPNTHGDIMKHGWVMKCDSNGSQEWSRTYAYYQQSNAYHVFEDIKPTSDGGYIVCGMADAGDENAWLVKLDHNGCLDPNSCFNVGTIETTVYKPQIKIFPNPASDQFIIALEGDAVSQYNNATFQLYNALGALVLEQPLTEQSTAVYRAYLPDGIYTYAVSKSDGKVVMGKLVLY